jgi:hypothetical protein
MYFAVNELIVDGGNATPEIVNNTYTFENINANHTIEVNFRIDQELFCGGTGIETDPYIICDVLSLSNLKTFVNSGNGNSTAGVFFKVDNSIDLIEYSYGAGWEPIGKYMSATNFSEAFQGTFDGNDQFIENLFINRNTTDNVGLFGYVYRATIKNVNIENCNVTGQAYVGGLAGSNFTSSKIDNCHVTGSITGNGDNVGGLVGLNNTNSIITNSSANCNILPTGNRSNYGGLVGQNVTTSTVSNSYA